MPGLTVRGCPLALQFYHLPKPSGDRSAYGASQTETPTMQTTFIRIFVTSQEQVDQVWLMFCQQTAIDKAEVWRDGSFQFLMVRYGEGPTRVPRGAFQGAAAPGADPAAP